MAEEPAEQGEYDLTLPGSRTRLVTHLDVDTSGIDRAVAAFAGFFRNHGGG